MSERWFRFYDAVPDDPKVLKLSDKQYRAWTFLLCIASRYGGEIAKGLEDAAIIMRTTVAKLAIIMLEMVRLELFEETETGFRPHNWNARQFKSDVSTDRVRALRERQRNVSSAVTETRSEDRVQKTETEKKKEAVAPAVLPDWLPHDVWDAFAQQRKKITPHAAKLLISALTKYREAGDDPKAVLEQSIMNGWRGLFPLKKTNGAGHGQRRESPHEQTERVARELIAELDARDAAGNHDRDREARNPLPGLLAYDPGIAPGMDRDAMPGSGAQIARRAAIRG